jgi:hypothetical protein
VPTRLVLEVLGANGVHTTAAVAEGAQVRFYGATSCPQLSRCAGVQVQFKI